MTTIQGGASLPVSVSTQPPSGGPAIPVAVVSDGRPTQGGPAQPVYVVSAAELASGAFRLEGGPARPVAAVSDGRAVQGGRPVPVYVVSGSLSPLTPQQQYIAKVVALSPIAYWPLDDDSGTTARDASGNGRTGTYSNVTLGATGPIAGGAAATLDGSTSFLNVYSASLAAAFSGAEGTYAVWARVSGAGVWTDGADRKFGIFLSGGSNFVQVRKPATNNTIQWFYNAGGTNETVSTTTSPTTWIHVAITWSKSDDAVKAYLNGAQVGATQTALGTYSGALSATQTLVGAGSTAPLNVWSGSLAHAALWARALSDAEIVSLATA